MLARRDDDSAVARLERAADEAGDGAREKFVALIKLHKVIGVGDVTPIGARISGGSRQPDDGLQIFVAVNAIAVLRVTRGFELAGAVPVSQRPRGNAELLRRLTDGQKLGHSRG